MGWVFPQARDKALALLDALERSRGQGFEVRAGLVGYRDRKDRDMLEVTAMAEDWAALRRAFDGLDAHGGGLPGENVQAGLDAALERITWRPGPDTTRLIYLIGDEPSVTHAALPSLQQLAARAGERGIMIHAINASHPSFPQHGEVETQWRAVADSTGGAYEEVHPALPEGLTRALRGLGGALRGLLGQAAL